MTSLLHDDRVAAPLWRTVPAAMSSAGREAVELAASAGLVLDDWQQQVLVDALGERRDGKWAAFEVGLIVPRQNGKGSVLEARELAGLFLFGEDLILHSAHEFKTAAEAFRRILSLVQGSRDLERHVMRVSTSHGQEGIELRSGQRLRFVARSKGSGRGFSGDTVILDESYHLSKEAMAALLPTMAARPNPQLWYTSSAPLPEERSDVLRSLCRRGRKGSSRLAYLEFCAAEGADADDRAAWAQANPGFGIRVAEEFVEQERGALDTESFERERLGLWLDMDDNRPRVISAEQWEACKDTGSRRQGGVCFAVDVTPDHKWTSIAVCGARADGLPHVETIAHRAGTEWVKDRCVELAEKHRPYGFVVDPKGPAGALVPELEQAKLNVVTVSGAEHAQGCGMLFEAATGGWLRHIGQADLSAAVDGAVKRPLGDAWAWSRTNSTVDISPLVAVTLALFGFNTLKPKAAAGFKSLDDYLEED